MKRTVITAAVSICLVGFAISGTATAQAGQQQLNPESARHYSLYYENYKAKNYQDATWNLHWILDNDPGFPRQDDRNFDRGVDIYAALAEMEEDPAQKRAYLDTALVILDKAVPVLQELGAEVDVFEWTLRKGRFIQTHVDALDDVKGQAIEAYWACYRMDPMQMDPYYLDVLVGDLYTSGDLGGALDFLRELNESRGEEMGVKGLVAKYFTVIPPGEQIAFLEEELGNKPGDAEIIQQLFELYQQEGYRDEMLGLAPEIEQNFPTTDNLRLLGRMHLEDGNAEEALRLYDKLSAATDVELVAQDYHNMGIARQDLESYGQAASLYRQALEADPEYSAARLAIANLYAAAASTCGIADREDAAVFWLISDAYSRAGDAAGAARMRTAFPTAEDIFYVQKWTAGQSTEVSYSCRGLTISGTTTVRQQ